MPYVPDVWDHDGVLLMPPGLLLILDTPRGPMTLDGAAEAFSVPKNTLRSRRFRGVSGDKLFQPPRPNYGAPILYWTPYGRVTLFGLSRATGIPRKTFYERLNNRHMRWSEEDAFNTPRYGVRGRHFLMPPAEYHRRLAAVQAETQ